MRCNEQKEVFFHMYCHECEYADRDQNDMPCEECLGEPTNEYSHMPIKFKKRIEKTIKRKRGKK